MNNDILGTSLGILTLKNPISVASGTFSFEYGNFYDINRLGAIVTKTITPESKIGNPPPRVYETECGMLNSIGLQNPGIEKFLSDDIYRYADISCPRIVSFSASKVADFVSMIQRLEECDIIDGYEVNVSCPNVENEGLAFGVDASIVYDLTSQLAKYTKKELMIKLSPNVTDIVKIAKAAEDGGATSISLINTLLGMAINYRTGKSYIQRGISGYSGPGIKPVALGCVYRVANAVKIPIMAMGGVSTMQDVIEFIYAGASVVAIGTAQFPDPLLPIKIIDELYKYMSENNITLSSIKGKVS
jgi:dihydroorotate dehydrogenase (NAD+) catalytic subunit